MPGHSVDFKGTDRTQRIKAAASKKGEAYEKFCKLNPPESELSNGEDATRRNIIVSPNESSSPDSFF